MHPLAPRARRAGRTAILLVSSLLVLLAASGVRAAHFPVNSANDDDDGNCNPSHCSLREAIVAANASPGPDLVSFELGAAILQPGSQLPLLTDDGTVIRGDGAIVLDGSQAPNANGLFLRSSHNRIQGLVVRDFDFVGIYVQGAVATGPADGNTIGTDGDGVEDALEGNVIHGNGASGIRIEGSNAEGNIVAGNRIGTNAAGDQARPNGGPGVSIDFGARGNRVGTDGDGTSDDLERNVVSANALHGISLGSDGSNTVAGNYVGFAADGVAPLGNAHDGIAAYFSDDNSIGPDNVIGSNGSNGVAIAASRGNRVFGNWIGTDVTGTEARGNGFNGVRIFAIVDTPAMGNQVGFLTSYSPPFLFAVKPAGNVIAHNAWNGIYIDSHSEGFLATDNPLLFNSIHSNELLGIDLVSSACPLGGCTDGVTLNDDGDTDGGGNDALNFPVIQFASRSSTHTYARADIVQGLPNTSFTLQFFANPECDDSGHGEGEVYLGQVGALTDAAGNLSRFAALPVPAPAGSVITSTASARGLFGIPNNTSEFSACAELLEFGLEHLASGIQLLLQQLAESGAVREGKARALAKRVENILGHASPNREGKAERRLRSLLRRLERRAGVFADAEGRGQAPG
jgi:CSLREA domain-containing protein